MLKKDAEFDDLLKINFNIINYTMRRRKKGADKLLLRNNQKKFISKNKEKFKFPSMNYI